MLLLYMPVLVWTTPVSLGVSVTPSLLTSTGKRGVSSKGRIVVASLRSS